MIGCTMANAVPISTLLTVPIAMKSQTLGMAYWTGISTVAGSSRSPTIISARSGLIRKARSKRAPTYGRRGMTSTPLGIVAQPRWMALRPNSSSR